MKIRMRTGKSLRQMASDLGISPAFLSSVENGKKKMPNSWFTRIPEIYSLSNEELEDFNTAAYESFETVEINLANATEMNKKLAVRFARRFQDIDEQESAALMQILEKITEEGFPDE
ncbi:MAG: helix-turn-helix transcriptional regulator [Clostridiales bacterium]|nr:helix-turn-helix transcriptional regulator [Clostridiales bacterium]